MKPTIPHNLIILKEACEKLNYAWEIKDEHSNNLVEVFDKKRAFFSSTGSLGLYPLNLKFASELAKDKAWTYNILKQKNYCTPKGDYFFIREEGRDLRADEKEKEDAIAFAKKTYPLFVKPNSKSLGFLTEIVHSEIELNEQIKAISEVDYIFHLQEIIHQNEYRLFVVDGEIQFAYQRIKPSFIGDGKGSIKDKLDEINQNIKGEKNKLSINSKFLENELKKRDLKSDSILKKGEKIGLSPNANIASGTKIQNYQSSFSSKTKEWVKKLMVHIPLRVCGIDIFSKNNLENPDGFTIIEINHSPSLSGIYRSGHSKEAVNIWIKILKKYFEE